MSDDVPSPGEIWRLLNKIDKRLDLISEQQVEREKLFVRQDVFEAVQAADALQMRGLEQEVHSVSKRLDTTEERRRQDRALLLGSLAFPLLVTLLGALLLTGRMG